MKPWEATQRGRKPDTAELRAHVAEGLSDAKIGDMYGVTRHTVGDWRRKAVPPIDAAHTRRTPVSHARHLPWKLEELHTFDPVARRLRLYSAKVQGVELKEKDLSLAVRFEEAVRESGTVINYSPERGFYRVMRDVNRDEPDLLVRAPTV